MYYATTYPHLVNDTDTINKLKRLTTL